MTMDLGVSRLGMKERSWTLVAKTDVQPKLSESIPSSKTISSRVTSLASQLAESAKRAEERDKTATWSSLKSIVSSVWKELSGYCGENKVKRDSEIPSGGDPAHLQRSQEATRFLHSLDPDKNPFKGFTSEQLELIAYDVEGPYTLNEREAALREHHRQEQVWRERICAASLEEYGATGKIVNFLKEILRYVECLSPIASADFPENYKQELAEKIERASTAPPGASSTDQEMQDSFLRTIFNLTFLDKQNSREVTEKKSLQTLGTTV